MSETTTPSTEIEADTEQTAQRSTGFRRLLLGLRRPAVATVVACFVLMLAALAYTGIQWNRSSSLNSARESALAAARSYATDLSTYDYTRLDTNFAAVNANAHGQFAEQYKQVSASLTALIKQNQAVSQGTVLSAGIVRADQDRAVVLLFVDQKITNTNSPQPRIDRNRMQMTLVHIDNRWLIDGIQLM